MFEKKDEYDNTWCVDEIAPATQENNWRCGLQGAAVFFFAFQFFGQKTHWLTGVLATYGALALGMWWVILSINLYISLVKEKVS